MSEQQLREAERLEAELRYLDSLQVERFRQEQLHLQAPQEPLDSSIVKESRPPPVPPQIDNGSDANVTCNTSLGNTKATCYISDNDPIKKASFRGRRFLLTLNEPSKWELLKDYLTQKNKPTYIIAALEEAPTTGHQHIHCFVKYGKVVTLSTAKLQGARVDICRGSDQQNIDYVEKDGKVIYEEGDKPAVSQPKQKLTVEKAIQLTPEEILQLNWTQYKAVRTIRDDYANKRLRENKYYKPIELVWLHGPTGTGKTRRAFEADCFPLIYNNGFFSDWGDSRKLVLEEFRGQIPYSEMLKLTDGYHGYYTLNIKGGQKVLDIDTLYITSPLLPQECYPQQAQKRDSISQLLRRITSIIQMGDTELEAHVPDPTADLNEIIYN